MQKTIHLTFGNIPLDIRFGGTIDPSKLIHKNMRHFIVPRRTDSRRSPSLSVIRCQTAGTARIRQDDISFLKKYFGNIYAKHPVTRHNASRMNIAIWMCRCAYQDGIFRTMVARARRSPGQWIIVNLIGSVLVIRSTSLAGTLFLCKDAATTNRADVLNAVSCVASIAAPSYRSLFLHGTGLRIRNKGYLFLGRSGAGKSTVARLAGKQAVLSDDGIIVGYARGGWRVSPAPLMQTAGFLKNKHSAAYELSGIYFLRQASHTMIRHLSPSKALSQILKYYVHFFRYCGIIRSKMIFNISRRLVGGRECNTLSFQKNKRFLNLLPGRKP